MPIPLSLIYPETQDPVRKADLTSLYKVIDEWVNLVATQINTGLFARILAMNIAVPAGTGSVVVTLTVAQPDTSYMVAIETNWASTHSLSPGSKTTTGFTVVFGTAAPAGGGVFSWAILR